MRAMLSPYLHLALLTVCKTILRAGHVRLQPFLSPHTHPPTRPPAPRACYRIYTHFTIHVLEPGGGEAPTPLTRGKGWTGTWDEGRWGGVAVQTLWGSRESSRSPEARRSR